RRSHRHQPAHRTSVDPNPDARDFWNPRMARAFPAGRSATRAHPAETLTGAAAGTRLLDFKKESLTLRASWHAESEGEHLLAPEGRRGLGPLRSGVAHLGVDDIKVRLQ